MRASHPVLSILTAESYTIMDSQTPTMPLEHKVHNVTPSSATDSAAPTAQIGDAYHNLMNSFDAFKASHDLRLELLERNQGDDVVLREKIDRINHDLGEQKKHLDSLIIASRRPTLEAPSAYSQADQQGSTAMRAWDQFMRKGHSGGLDFKDLSTNTNAEGGFIAPPEIEQTVTRLLTDISPLRSLASVRAISAGVYKKPVSLGDAGTGWVAEAAARPKTTTPTLTEIEFPAMELYAMPAASSVLLDDAMVSIEQWLGEEIRIKFAEQETKAFVNGSGTTKPKGFLAYTTVNNSSWAHNKIGYLPSGGAGGFKTSNPSDVLIELIYSLKPFYRHNAHWVMNRKTLTNIRKFKDSDGSYLWSPGLGAGQSSTLLGYPVVEIEDMPDIGANTMAIAFGDFRAGYLIVDRAGLRVLRDPYTAKPYTLFYTTRRVGGGVQNFDAIKLLKFATS